MRTIEEITNDIDVTEDLFSAASRQKSRCEDKLLGLYEELDEAIRATKNKKGEL